MQIIPLSATPSQSVKANLGGQNCRIDVYQKAPGLFLDLYVDDSPIVTGRLCLNDNRIIRDEYLGFVGDLAFIDTLGSADPVHAGIGDRFQLIYIEASEL